MALDKLLKIYDENGNDVDYDILAKDVKLLPDGKDLPTKLSEMEQDIEQAASGGYAPPEGGIPATDLAQAVQDILNDVANKVDKIPGKGLSTEDFTAALKAKLEALDPYTKAQVDAAIQQAIGELGGGSVESVTINGVNHEPTNGIVDLGTVEGQQGPKGEQGDTLLVDDNFDPVTMIVNGLDDSDGTVALSARQGKILKQAVGRVQANLQTVLDALANMAFTGNKPTLTAIDWTGGTFYATINKTLSGCTATDNTTNGQIAEGSTLTMTLTASSGYTLTGAIISVTNSKGQSVAYTLNNNVITISNVIGTINISVAAKAIHQISLGSGSSNVAFASGTSTEAVDGSSWTGTIEAASGYKLPASIDVTMGGNSVIPTYNSTSGAITIASVTGAVVITAVAVEAGKVNVTKTLNNVIGSDNTVNGQMSEGENYQGVFTSDTIDITNMVNVRGSSVDMTSAFGGDKPITRPLVISSNPNCVSVNDNSAVVTHNQDGTVSVGVNNVQSDLAIGVDAMPKVLAGYKYDSPANGMVTQANKGCLTSPLKVPLGYNYIVFKHNSCHNVDNNDYSASGAGRNGVICKTLTISINGSFGGDLQASAVAGSDENNISISNATEQRYLFASFAIGTNNQRAMLNNIKITAYVMPSGSTNIEEATAEQVLFDGSKAEIVTE